MKELPHRLREACEMGYFPNSIMAARIVIPQLNTITENHL